MLHDEILRTRNLVDEATEQVAAQKALLSALPPTSFFARLEAREVLRILVESLEGCQSDLARLLKSAEPPMSEEPC